MNSENYNQLANTDRKRLQLRRSYRDSISHPSTNDKERTHTNYIYFPKSVIGKNNEQLRYGLPWLYNGFVISYGDTTMAVDPGVNFVLRLTENGYDLSSINHVFLSHLHLDHTADANTLMEWSIRAQKDTKVYAPKSVFETRAISEFHAGIATKFLVKHSSQIINNESLVNLPGNVTLEFIEMRHGVECYGFILTTPETTICYISDTGYAQEVIPRHINTAVDIHSITEPTDILAITRYHQPIKQAVEKARILIVNIDSFLHNKNSSSHLSVMDLLHMVKDSRVERIILGHINPLAEVGYEEWGAKIARFVEAATGIATNAIPAEGLRLGLPPR